MKNILREKRVMRAVINPEVEKLKRELAKKYTITLTTNGHRSDETQRANTDNTFTDKDEARAKAKRLNKLLSKGEKEYYKLKYKVFAV